MPSSRGLFSCKLCLAGPGSPECLPGKGPGARDLSSACGREEGRPGGADRPSLRANMSCVSETDLQNIYSQMFS